ncbi:ATP-dependent Clp protease adaptor ClpS [Helicobacter didelphidarum]|uniref:ATP-dependent Clp protease adapter protein ClpS n=1 Tax=Helicobacter didelphidarum TaxID=2040648 RepID=A0A3D8IQZ3_9HELI|nr:ATP-dependent Clp protease adaptor ClpS [Helicobacter didelphidarum]RDU67034.1 ATP-dependent Clp protease adaptor ClpS [Helicobacter didelphidarum]
MPNNKSQYSNEYDYETINEIEVALPKMQEIIIFNDDYTSMQFVIALLMEIFDKNEIDAQTITQFVHNTGEGSCGIYPYDIAELKYIMAINFIQDNKMPLRIDKRDVL